MCPIRNEVTARLEHFIIARHIRTRCAGIRYDNSVVGQYAMQIGEHALRPYRPRRLRRQFVKRIKLGLTRACNH